MTIANRFVAARRNHQALGAFPGALPTTLEEAYSCQDMAIKLWADHIGGWKVGLIGKQFQQQYAQERLVGPIFNSFIWYNAKNQINSVPIFVDGFGAVEAEFVFKIGTDAPAKKIHWTLDEAMHMVASLHAGVEIASSPLSVINDLGPTSVISDFGNNNGLIIGAPIDNWENKSLTSLTCETHIEGQHVGKGNAASIPGGPLASLAFALSNCASRGFPLRTGQHVCTGAVTGVHQIMQGQRARIHFDNVDDFECVAVESGDASQ